MILRTRRSTLCLECVRRDLSEEDGQLVKEAEVGCDPDCFCLLVHLPCRVVHACSGSGADSGAIPNHEHGYLCDDCYDLRSWLWSAQLMQRTELLSLPFSYWSTFHCSAERNVREVRRYPDVECIFLGCVVSTGCRVSTGLSFLAVWNLACGFATTLPQLMIFRLLAGIGGSAPLVVSEASSACRNIFFYLSGCRSVAVS